MAPWEKSGRTPAIFTSLRFFVYRLHLCGDTLSPPMLHCHKVKQLKMQLHCFSDRTASSFDVLLNNFDPCSCIPRGFWGSHSAKTLYLHFRAVPCIILQILVAATSNFKVAKTIVGDCLADSHWYFTFIKTFRGCYKIGHDMSVSLL